MRGLIYALAALAIIALAYWAYNENYATQAALRRVDTLQQQIGDQREKLGVLRAEWAYLNRPDRLRELADLNYLTLGLMPLTSVHFGLTEQVAFPQLDVNDITGPVDLSADLSADLEPPLAEAKP